MSRHLQAMSAAVALLWATTAPGLAAADPSPRGELSERQLDLVCAGVDRTAKAQGAGEAVGKSARADVSVANLVRGAGTGAAVGRVSASATASPGALASASSTLSLSVALP